MTVQFTKKFRKQLANADQKVQNAFEDRLVLFFKDQQHPMLNNHRLMGRLLGSRNINITGDWRAIYSERDMGTNAIVIFELLGTHGQLYG